jgi:phosphoribosylaminoimidazole synthetase
LDTIGIDLVAMNVNDLIAGGAEPLFFMDYIALDKMDKTKCNTIIRGIQKGCKMADCELVGGETAEMKGIYMKNRLDLAGFAVGEMYYHLPGKECIKEGHLLYGLKSSGLHSNGYTLVNKLLKRCHPSDHPPIEDILKPTHIYTEINDLRSEEFVNCCESILGVAHITGGGFRDNLPRILPEHLTYELIEWEFPDIFQWIQKESQSSREEMLATFNCGYGMVIVAEKEIDSPILTRIGCLVRKT